MISNALAILGLILVSAAVSQLAGGWWACLLDGLALVAASYAAHTQGR